MTPVKTIIAWFFFLVLSYTSAAQQYDKVWALGAPVSTMAFQGDSIVLKPLADSTTQSFNTIASICDIKGNFLFYSNGISVFNRYGQIMPNGDSLSYPSEYYDQVTAAGMPGRQDVIILPQPNDSNHYYIFHYSAVDTILVGGGYESLNLYYSIVDMRLDGGMGAVTQKNVPIIQNELLSSSRLAACRHANGRDWWIVKPAWHENIYYTFLLTPDSLLGPFIQQIGPVYGADNEFPAYSTFSPDGSKYASVTTFSYVVLMDFDRCTGLFSNPDSIYNNDNYAYNGPNTGGDALAFSPSGRFLYVNDPIELNQYDLWSTHFKDSVIIFIDTEFYQMNIMQVAPNGKLYVSCFNGGSYAIHVINEPDSLGVTCDFQFLGQDVLTPNSTAVPYFPNFKLGSLAGSGCDTIVSGLRQVDADVCASLAPNPATNMATISYYNHGSTVNKVEVYNMLGEIALTQTDLTNSGKIDMNVSTFAAGIYMVRFTSDGKVLLNTRLVIQH